LPPFLGASNGAQQKFDQGSPLNGRENVREILGVKIAATTYKDLVAQSVAWAQRGESRAVCFANVHVLMEAFDDPGFRDQLNAADIVNPDGMPLVWSLRALGEPRATRVYGPDATEMLLQAAQASGIPVAFCGGSHATLAMLILEVQRRYPQLEIACAISPPFRALDGAEDRKITEEITASGARMLFVGLGCPKQERWIMTHHGEIPAVMFGVGAAFDFLAGSKPQAPRWMMKNGLEWAFRLASEPRRLAVRYLKHNPRFVLLSLHQLMKRRMSGTL
jgi:N-acetylglucosaminyldiphosphoundecaprenol N-acetyl-beta-D-mannosaminyltransferase